MFSILNLDHTLVHLQLNSSSQGRSSMVFLEGRFYPDFKIAQQRYSRESSISWLDPRSASVSHDQQQRPPVWGFNYS